MSHEVIYLKYGIEFTFYHTIFVIFYAIWLW